MVMTRGERRRRTELVAARRLAQLRCVIPTYAGVVQMGRGRTKSHLGCGRPRCGVCHLEKLDRKTKRKRRRYAWN